MKKGDAKINTGFTIIEISLVLAIAGLIMLMMFIALPALQRNARDTERKEDISTLVNAIKKYQGNNRGALPPDSKWKDALSQYLSDNFKDPNGDDYIWNVSNCGARTDANCKITPNTENTLYIITGAKCHTDGETGAIPSSSPRKYAVLYQLEGGGIYCQDG